VRLLTIIAGAEGKLDEEASPPPLTGEMCDLLVDRRWSSKGVYVCVPGGMEILNRAVRVDGRNREGCST
jgi:hypothetical protein